jgi:hypothetical protein
MVERLLRARLRNKRKILRHTSGAYICYDSGLIKPLKTSSIHFISAIFSASPIIPAFGKIWSSLQKQYAMPGKGGFFPFQGPVFGPGSFTLDM